MRLSTAHNNDSSLQFKYVVQATDHDGDGISIAATALTLNGGSIADANGTPPNLSLGSHAIAIATRHTVNDTRPYFGVPGGYHGPVLHFVQNNSVSETLEAANSGDGTLTYSLQGALPNGLTFNNATRVLSGSPTTALAQTAYYMRASDADGDYALLSFWITVANENAPQVSRVRISSTPLNTGNYIAGEDLSVEVVFDEAVVVTGTPNVRLGIGDANRYATYQSIAADSVTLSFSYTITSEDSDSDGISIAALGRPYPSTIRARTGGLDASLRLGNHVITNAAGHKVRDTASPTFRSVMNARYYTKDASVNDQLPAAMGGDGTLTYALSPTSLPAGLTWTASTRTIAGTPTTVTAATSYTYTATDGDGDAISQTFTIAVSSHPVVSGVTITSTPATGDAYDAGETIAVNVTFDEPVAAYPPQSQPRADYRYVHAHRRLPQPEPELHHPELPLHRADGGPRCRRHHYRRHRADPDWQRRPARRQRPACVARPRHARHCQRHKPQGEDAAARVRRAPRVAARQ